MLKINAIEDRFFFFLAVAAASDDADADGEGDADAGGDGEGDADGNRRVGVDDNNFVDNGGDGGYSKMQ